MTSDLTPRQRSVLAYVIEHQQKHFIAPTVREIAAHLGLRSPAGVHRILNLLKDKGYIVAEAGKKRSWRVGKPSIGRGIPLIGTIAAGAPVEAIQHVETELAVSPSLFGCERCFGLRVSGESMIDAHIVDGDLAIIRPQKRVESGDIAAVLIEDILPEATLKIVRYTRTTFTLEAANPEYAPLVFKGYQRKRVSILGKFVGIVRCA